MSGVTSAFTSGSAQVPPGGDAAAASTEARSALASKRISQAPSTRSSAPSTPLTVAMLRSRLSHPKELRTPGARSERKRRPRPSTQMPWATKTGSPRMFTRSCKTSASATAAAAAALPVRHTSAMQARRMTWLGISPHASRAASNRRPSQGGTSLSPPAADSARAASGAMAATAAAAVALLRMNKFSESGTGSRPSPIARFQAEMVWVGAEPNGAGSKSSSATWLKLPQ
mmetsp:Transcript_111026/g.279176  ORF Transcript_111026/g.279176 Transcript_111026/m.279176 type:complete len:229 (+) Transcript_111026:85-771(+)